MNQLRRAFIMAHLVKYGWVKRRVIQEAFGMSGRNATNDLTKFQELHGPLEREPGRSHVYRLPENYDVTVPMDEVSTVVKLINETLMSRKPQGVTT